MKINTIISIIIITIAILGGQASSSTPALADKLPQDAIIYLGWSGNSLTFSGSMFGQLINEQGTKNILSVIHSACVKNLAGDADSREMFQALWSMGSIAWKHPSAAVLLDIAVPHAPAGKMIHHEEDFYPQAAMIIDLKNDKEAFNVHLQKFLTRLGKNVKLTQITFGNVSYHSFDTPAGPCAIGFVGKIFFTSIGKGVPMKIAETINGKAKSLASQKKFANAMKELCSDNVQIAAYIDVKRLIKKVETIINAQGKQGRNARLSKDTIVFRNVIKALGFDGVTVIAGASNIVDRGFHEKIRILSPAPHKGILSLLAENHYRQRRWNMSLLMLMC